MEIGNTTIVTPIDNPCQFDPDWRNLIALALLDSSNPHVDIEYKDYLKDKWVSRQIQFYKAVRSGRKLTDEQKNLRLASIWYQGSRISDTKYRLEPLLLTPVSFEVISLDIGGGTIPVDAFEAYEKLYFNVRLDNGRLHPSCQLRQYFALPSGQIDDDTSAEQIWKTVGALMGYDTLVSIWLWTDAHGKTKESQEYMLDEMWRVAQSRLFMNMFSNRIGHESMAKLLASFTSQTKLIKDQQESGQVGLDTTKTLMAILYKSAPEIVSTAKNVDAFPAMTEEIRAKLSAQQAIDMKSSMDLGDQAGEKAFVDKLAENFYTTDQP